MRTDSLPIMKQAPLLMRALLLLGAIEVIATLVLPSIIPDTTYLDLYLPEASEASISQFLMGEGLLVPDPVTGWRSAPGQSVRSWSTDSLGARVRARPPHAGPDSRLHIVALGSSMMNGGTFVSNAETITAYLESDQIEASNYGTMLFGFDQSYLAYVSRHAAMDPDIVLVGVDMDAEDALKNVFVPLRRPSETNMPFTKPRFVLSADGLQLVSPPPLAFLAEPRDSLIAHFEKYDGHRSRFNRFKRSSLTPVASALVWLLRRTENLYRRYRPAPGSEDLLLALADQFRSEVGDNRRLLLLVMPGGVSDQERLPFEPDHYARRLELLRTGGFEVVDARRALLSSGIPTSLLYGQDSTHLSATGNEIVAAAVREVIVH